MRILKISEKGFDRYLLKIERRRTQEDYRLEKKVRFILKEVQKRGDQALLDYTQAFDGLRLTVDQLQIKRGEIKEAYRQVPQDLVETLKKAAHRIRTFHHRSGLKEQSSRKKEEDGIWLEEVKRPLERVGIYVPGGKASYPSTVLMAAIPAKVAGVPEVLMVTPPQKNGIHPGVLIAADLAGVDRIYQVGGVQAIAALAYGTPSIPKVDKIVGPGNQYVATAKRLVYGDVDIDMIAGPSEIVILSDQSTPPSFAAADLLSQAEHDEMALPILITTSEKFGKEVKKEIDRQLSFLRRKNVAQISLRKRGAILIVKTIQQAIEVVNQIAPEHLELAVSKPYPLSQKVKHAGAIFLGRYTPEAIGDYMAGPNHILPTAGTARFFSPLGVSDFIKKTNLMAFTKNALKRFEEDVKRFAEWEGLEGHSQAVQVRMKNS